MKCPVDQQRLRRGDIEPGLSGYHCEHCLGHWVRFGDYLGWRDRQQGDVPEVTRTPTPDSVPVVSAAPPAPGSIPRRCPDCDYLLTRFRVGHGVEFALDRCGNCNGVWLDQGEWDTLRARGLHDNVHEVFSTAWQMKVRTEAQRELTEAQFARQLGPSDFAKAKEFGTWLATHPRPSEMLAYLQWLIR